MKLNKSIGIVIVLIFIGIFAYFLFAPRTQLSALVVSKNKVTSPDGKTTDYYVNVKISGQEQAERITITGINTYFVQLNEREVWSSLTEGNTYTFECISFFGTWHCDKILNRKE
jgi:hypothetical protein